MPVKLFHGDCHEILKKMEDNSVHAVVTDPPYGLSDHSTTDVTECLTAWLSGKPYQHNKSGFMSAEWDGWVPGPEVWKEVFRVLKPGGHMLVFSSTRSYDLTVMALRLAGFEVRDQLCWLHSQGMPRGMDISKAIDKKLGAERKVIGVKVNTYDGNVRDPSKHSSPAETSNIGEVGYTKTSQGLPLTEPATEEAEKWEGWNTTLKPSIEPIVLVRKPLDGSIVDNVLLHGVGGLNVDDCRIPIDPDVDDPRLGGNGSWSTDGMSKSSHGDYKSKLSGFRPVSSELGRFPTNTLWDGSDEVREVFDTFGEKASGKPGRRRKNHETKSMAGTLGMLDRNEVGYADKGGVHRFFKDCRFSEEERRIYYCGKVVSSKDRHGKHPTQKPVSLCEYLCRLIVPEGGIVLDPFAGTGTTGEAAALNGFDCILIERELEYYNDCLKRLGMFLE